jgi:hypothetical protein
MSLRRSPILTRALLEANRRNAQKSTGPRTLRGKAQSSLNNLQTGGRSRVYRELCYGLLAASPCSVDRTAAALLTPEQAAHPLLAEIVDLAREAEVELVMDTRRHQEFFAGGRKTWTDARESRLAPAKTSAESAPHPEQAAGQRKKDVKVDGRSRKVYENK